jgi:hypothetical protein
MPDRQRALRRVSRGPDARYNRSRNRSRGTRDGQRLLDLGVGLEQILDPHQTPERIGTLEAGRLERVQRPRPSTSR